MSYLTGDSLKVRIRIAFGASIAANPGTWTWTDVTDRWHTPDDVTIKWGRSSGAGQAETSTLSLTLKNTDGRFTAYDARSPHWPHVRKWTPIQYDIDLGDGVGWRNRFSGFLRKLPLTWPGASPLMALARIEAVGALGRLGRGKPPARSPMRRTYLAADPLAYWPLEDGSSSTVLASALPDHPPMTVVGPITIPDLEGWTALGTGQTYEYGTDRLVDVSAGASLTASVPPSVTAATAAGFTAVVTSEAFPFGGSPVDQVLLEVETPGGTFARWQVFVAGATVRTQVRAITAAGAVTVVADEGSVSSGLDNRWLAVWQDGSLIRVGHGQLNSSNEYPLLGNVAGTLAGATRVSVNTTRAVPGEPWPVGHIALWAGHHLPLTSFRLGENVVASFTGFAFTWTNGRQQTGEGAVDRFVRLCAEEGVPLSTTATLGVFDPPSTMGLQPSATFVDLIDQCEQADMGVLHESGFGLGYLSRAGRYNAPAALTIDAAAGQLGTPFDPVDDDQTLRNRWTVQRIDGSSAVASDPASIDLQGLIEDSVSLNLALDNQLPDQAGFRLRLSTVQEPRYPAVSVNLSAHRELAAAWCACQPGSRIQVVNPPAQNVPGVVDQLVVGATETYRGRRYWRASLNVEPASRWDVATADGDPRPAADGSTLAAGISASATSLQITSTVANGIWTTNPADFPMDIRVGGERVTLSGISGSSSPQTATVSARGVNGVARAWGAGTEVDVWQPAIVPL